jgi:putative membrane protein
MHAVRTGALLICSFFIGLAYAADQPTASDKEFMTKAAQGNLFEVQSGELAQKTATNEDVRKLAARFIADHTQNNEELRKLAAKYKFELPNEPDESQSKQMQRLQKLNGTDFERTYVKLLIEDHQTAIALFEKQAGSSSADLKQFAEKSLPVLREHLKLARETQEKLK